jgi:hypothetical protein
VSWWRTTVHDSDDPGSVPSSGSVPRPVTVTDAPTLKRASVAGPRMVAVGGSPTSISWVAGDDSWLSSITRRVTV